MDTRTTQLAALKEAKKEVEEIVRIGEQIDACQKEIDALKEELENDPDYDALPTNNEEMVLHGMNRATSYQKSKKKKKLCIAGSILYWLIFVISMVIFVMNKDQVLLSVGGNVKMWVFYIAHLVISGIVYAIAAYICLSKD